MGLLRRTRHILNKHQCVDDGLDQGTSESKPSCDLTRETLRAGFVMLANSTS